MRKPFARELSYQRHQPFRRQWDPVVSNQLDHLADRLEDFWMHSFRQFAHLLLLAQNPLEDRVYIAELPCVIKGPLELVRGQRPSYRWIVRHLVAKHKIFLP